ncbi:metal ABC transporter permease [Puteibacter caeruleilacunae]|nr:metal ABC transporter permease [Puteibacter caeruleilacunae]
MNQILELFSYDFFLNAFLAAIFAAISCGIIGTYIVSRRIVFISGGITHASFGGVGIAYFMGLNPIFGAAVFGVLSALGIQTLSRKTNIREDSAIAILWSLGMAVGIIFIFLTPGYAPNLMSYLFGNILTVTSLDLSLLAGLSVILMLVFYLFYNVILYIAFDEDYARAHHLPVNFYSGVLMSLVALTIVFNIKVVGIILVISLLTIPQAIAGLFSKQFKTLLFLSVGWGFIGAFVGLLVSYFVDIPSGASIIFTLVVIYAVAKLIIPSR